MSGLGVKVATGGDRGVDAACTLQPGTPDSSPPLGLLPFALLISQRRGLDSSWKRLLF